ncbi:hypothetical protein K474DRAFT_1678753 [Panus rudis PR-1116 ss-1]|nr:hypothetical protein K474DRAFT_1678753 [Panus rudis PR-1116 ss-1]
MDFDFSDIRDLLASTYGSPFFLGSEHFLSNVQFRPLNNHTDILIGRPVNDVQIVKPAEVQLVGQLEDADCRLLCCGGWKDNWMRGLHEAKAVGVMVRPLNKKMDRFWRNVPGNVQQLQEMHVSRAGYNISNVLLVPSGGIKIRHQLYKPRSAQDPSSVRDSCGSRESTPMSSVSDSTIATLPAVVSPSTAAREWVDACVHPSARNAAAALLREGHFEAVPIPVYYPFGGLVPPSAYRDALPGSLVWIKVVITRQYVSTNRSYHIFADIVEIKMLRSCPRVVADGLPAGAKGGGMARN